MNGRRGTEQSEKDKKHTMSIMDINDTTPNKKGVKKSAKPTCKRKGPIRKRFSANGPSAWLRF